MLSKLKAQVDWEKLQVIVFQYSAKKIPQNSGNFASKDSELSLLCSGLKLFCCLLRTQNSPHRESRVFREFRGITVGRIFPVNPIALDT